MVIPGANGRVNEAAKEKQKADEQYDAGHSGVKTVSFAHTRGLTHSLFPGHALLGDGDIKAQRKDRSIPQCVNNRQCYINYCY